MNTNQYLDEAFYRNISTSEDKTFDFADGKSIKYRTAVNGTSLSRYKWDISCLLRNNASTQNLQHPTW